MKEIEIYKERFFKSVKIGATNECWLWNGRIDERGFPCFSVKHKKINAYRLSYRIFKGKIRKNISIIHKCNKKHCVNPEHLIHKQHDRDSKFLKNSNIVRSTKNIFYSKILMPDENGCMHFIDPYPDGYGYFASGKKTYRAHRYSYQLHNGKISKSKLVCHKCDNRSCVAPDHLFLGSYKDNYQDAKSKNRHTHGEIQGSAKLTDKKVKEIKNLLKLKIPQRKIAKQFNVCQSTIRYINVGKTWSHVQWP